MKTQIALPQSESVLTRDKATEVVQTKATTRLLFVDNLRIYLTILVILHHLLIIYSGAGGWIWQEGREDVVTSVLAGWFTAVNHSYFMGMFLLISAYFVPGSYDRKGPGQFLKDRFIRLGIPLVLYSWLIRALLIYAGNAAGFTAQGLSFLDWYFWQYFRDYGWIGGGPLWFISALLLFSGVYAILRMLMPARLAKRVEGARFPSNSAIAGFALMIALASFIVRFWFPSDTVFQPMNFQLADFPQYIAMFIVGLVAYRQNWLRNLPQSVGKLWLVIAIVLILVMPVVAVLGGSIEDDTPFKGGWHWQAIIGATWQAYLCVSMTIGLIYLFQRYLDRQGSLARFLSPNAYTAYLIHEPVITFAAIAATGLMIYPLLKFGLMSLLLIPLIFGLSSLIRRLPYTQRVL